MKIYEDLIKERIAESNKSLDCFPSYANTQHSIVELIDLYWVDKFRDGDYDKKGWKKFFYGIIDNPTNVASKMVDLDTKNIQLIAEEGQSYYPVWFLEKDLKGWMKAQNFAKLLNDIVYSLPKYGSVILKKVQQKIELVPLQNVFRRPDLNKLEDSGLMEKHEWSQSKLKKMKGIWIDEAIDKSLSEYKEDDIVFYEIIGEEIDGYNYYICDEKNNVFFKDNKEINDLYREVKWEDIPGRALGRGQVEKLFEAQIHSNRIANYKTKGLHWTSKHLWQSKDTTFSKNLTTDVDDGEVLVIKSELTPVAMEERNLGAYREEENRLDKLIADKSFAYDIMAGERPPSGTPLGTAILQTQQAGGFYDLKREDIGIFIKEIIFDWVIPFFKKENTKEHQMIFGEMDAGEIEKLRKMMVIHNTNKEVWDYIFRTGEIPTREKVDLIQNIEKGRVSKKRGLLIPANFYEGLRYRINVLITNEQIDMSAKLVTAQQVLVMLANPAFLQDPRARKMFYWILDKVGFSPTDFEDEESSEAIPPQNVGSIAPIATPTTPRTATNMQVV